MPTIYMTHPQHGATHVYTNEDATKHEALGWVRSEYKVKVLSDEELADEYEALKGHRPHHRMKRETIEAELRK